LIDVTARTTIFRPVQPFGSVSKFDVIGWSSSVKCQARIEIPSEVNKSKTLLDVMAASGPATTLDFFFTGYCFQLTAYKDGRFEYALDGKEIGFVSCSASTASMNFPEAE
jgi:hypothetical protein